MIRIDIPSEMTTYCFTLPKHPAHPSVVIRKITSNKGEIFIETTGHTQGNTIIFEKWLNQFKQQDQDIKQQFSKS